MALGGRCALAFLTACAGVALAQSSQSSLPRIQPTQLAPPAALSSTAAAPPASPAHRAEVSYQLGQLTVIAQNSSLDDILREVARQTGMKITGGVLDQRVFGTYGPAHPSVVLARLLEGSGSNMILRETAANQPMELILSPRQGTPTPPALGAPTSPAAAPVSQPAPPVAQSYQPSPQPVFQSTQTPASVQRAPPQYVAQPSSASATAPPAASPTVISPAQQASPAASNPQSPTGVLTPQQIYQQLQKLQQQQQPSH